MCTAIGVPQGVVNLLEAIQEAGLADKARFFEASSCEIFGRASIAPMDEGSPLHPQTPYGKSKLLAFITVKHYRCAWPIAMTCAVVRLCVQHLITPMQRASARQVELHPARDECA